MGLVDIAISATGAQEPMSTWMRAVTNAAAQAAGGAGGVQTPVPFLLQPGGTASPGVYLTMAALAAAAAPAIAAGKPIIVAIDDTLAPATVSGVVALDNYDLVSGRADGQVATITALAGASFAKPCKTIEGVQFAINALAAGQSLFNIAADTRVAATNMACANTGLGRLFKVTAPVTLKLDMYGTSDLTAGTGLAIQNDPGNVLINQYDATKMDALSLGGTGTNQTTLQSSAARAAATPNYALVAQTTGVFFIQKLITLAQLQAAGAVAAATFVAGSPLPSPCEVLRAEIEMTPLNVLAGPGLVSALSTLEAAGETPGALLGSMDLTLAGVKAPTGSNPIVSRSGQQLQLSIALAGGTLFNQLTAGTVRVKLYAVLALAVGTQP